MRLSFLIVLLATSLGCGVAQAGDTLPKETAAHFCRLLVNDGEGRVCTLSSYIRKHQTETSDSLTLEQLFTTYVFHYDGWKTLRIFPHSDGHQVNWYAATDALPSNLDQEHQRYIHEVFQRLAVEVEAGRWATVDAYIDRIVQYQCRFAAVPRRDASRQPIAGIVGTLLFLFLLCPLLMTKRAHVSLSYITKQVTYEKNYRDRSSCMPCGQGDSR